MQDPLKELADARAIRKKLEAQKGLRCSISAQFLCCHSGTHLDGCRRGILADPDPVLFLVHIPSKGIWGHYWYGVS